jgi:hypothetical protein
MQEQDITQQTLSAMMGQYYKPSGAIGFLEGTILSNQPLTLRRHTLSSMYREIDIVRLIINMPIKDALAGGVLIHTDASDNIEKEIEDNIYKVLQAVEKVMIYNRLFGGSILLIDEGPSNGGQTENQATFQKRMSEPLNVKNGSSLQYIAVDPWSASGMATSVSQAIGRLDLLDEKEYKSKKFKERLTPSELKNIHFYHQGKMIVLNEVNESRILTLTNGILTPLEEPLYRGWGRSELEHCKVAIANLLKMLSSTTKQTQANGLILYKTIDTMDGANTRNEKTQEIAQLIQECGAVAISNDETIEVLEVEAGKMENLRIAYTNLSIASNIPQSRLLGESVSGLSNEDSSMTNYYRLLESARMEMMPIIKMLLKYEITARSKDFEALIDSLDITWKEPLKKETQADVIAKQTLQTNLINQLHDKGIVNDEELKQMIDKINILPTHFEGL